MKILYGWRSSYVRDDNNYREIPKCVMIFLYLKRLKCGIDMQKP